MIFAALVVARRVTLLAGVVGIRAFTRIVPVSLVRILATSTAAGSSSTAATWRVAAPAG